MPDPLLQAIELVRRDCSEIQGVMLATPEGLEIAAAGTLRGDVAAAAGTQIADVLDGNLRLLETSACSDALVWTPGSVWGVARLPTAHVVFVHARPGCAAATLRLALARFRRDLGRLVAEWSLPDTALDG